MSTEEKKGFLYDWEDQRVPETATRPWWDIAYVQLGLFTSGFMLMTGGLLVGSGWPWYHILAWLVVGNLIILGLYVAIGHIGVKERLPTAFIAEVIFGKYGAKVFNIVLVGTIMAWAALGIHQLALAITDLTGVSIYVTAWIAALLVWLSSSAGYKTISILSKLAIPWFVTILFIVELYYGFKLGWNFWGQKAPYGGVFNTFWDGVTFVVGLNIVASFLQANSSRYAKSTKDFIKASTFSVFFGMILLTFLSCTLAAYALTPENSFADPFLIATRTMGVVGGIMAWILIWTTADNDFWHLSLSMVELYPKVRRWIYDTILVIFSIIVIYAGVLYRYTDFATTLSILWPAIPGIFIAHYYILPKIGVDIYVIKKRNLPVNALAIISWIVGAVVAYFVKSYALPLPELAALVAALVVYAIGMMVYKGK